MKSQHFCRVEYPEAKIETARLDLSDLKSVRAFGREAQDLGHPVDVLLNNAGRHQAFEPNGYSSMLQDL